MDEYTLILLHNHRLAVCQNNMRGVFKRAYIYMQQLCAVWSKLVSVGCLLEKSYLIKSDLVVFYCLR